MQLRSLSAWVTTALIVAGVSTACHAQETDTRLSKSTIAAIVSRMQHSACKKNCPIRVDGVDFLVTRVDLNSDGVAEYLAEGTAEMCGSGGCMINVLASVSGRWADVLDFLGPAPLILRTATDGYHDLLIGFGSMRPGAEAYLYTWNGHIYAFKGTRSASGKAPASIPQ